MRSVPALERAVGDGECRKVQVAQGTRRRADVVEQLWARAVLSCRHSQMPATETLNVGQPGSYLGRNNDLVEIINLILV
uniref:Uncharacterized protein n=1 Tax=Arundo donax TaxID=35708 RepID=A0A0A8XN84_ARUDO